MFIGRERELQSLQKMYEKNSFEMCVLYGRRRIGKSTLISKFLEDKKYIFYTASKVGGSKNTQMFFLEAMRTLDPSIQELQVEDFDKALDIINNKLTNERIVIVIDELPYWAKSDPSILSTLQKYIDHYFLNKNIMIILCGSSLSFMEDEVLSHKSPLFGRRTSQIKLEAFNYLDSARFVENYSYEDKAIVYGITGGIAKYLAMINPNLDIHENIINLFFSLDGYLYEETRNYLTQEFSDTQVVNNIIEQIANGEGSLNVIADKIHENANTISYNLDKLISVGLVEKRQCILDEGNKKKTKYVLKDNMFKFWYEFVPKGNSFININKGEIYYNSYVKDKLHSFMGKIFEDICNTYLMLRNNEHLIFKTGTWWGQEKIENSYQACDIDVVGVGDIDKVLYVGECKFKNEDIKEAVLLKLIERSHLISKNYRIGKYLLFSLNGFENSIKEKYKDVELINIEQIYKV